MRNPDRSSASARVTRAAGCVEPERHGRPLDRAVAHECRADRAVRRSHRRHADARSRRPSATGVTAACAPSALSSVISASPADPGAPACTDTVSSLRRSVCRDRSARWHFRSPQRAAPACVSICTCAASIATPPLSTRAKIKFVPSGGEEKLPRAWPSPSSVELLLRHGVAVHELRGDGRAGERFPAADFVCVDVETDRRSERLFVAIERDANRRARGRHDEARVGRRAARVDAHAVGRAELVVGMRNRDRRRAVASGAHRLIDPRRRRPRHSVRDVSDVHVRRTNDRHVHDRVAARRLHEQRNVGARIARTALRRDFERQAAGVRIHVHGRSADAAVDLRERRIVAGGRVRRHRNRSGERTGRIERNGLLPGERRAEPQRHGRRAGRRTQHAALARPRKPDDAHRVARVDDRRVAANRDDRRRQRRLRQQTQERVAVAPLREREDRPRLPPPAQDAVVVGRAALRTHR